MKFNVFISLATWFLILLFSLITCSVCYTQFSVTLTKLANKYSDHATADFRKNITQNAPAAGSITEGTTYLRVQRELLDVDQANHKTQMLCSTMCIVLLLVYSLVAWTIILVQPWRAFWTQLYVRCLQEEIERISRKT